MVNSEWKEVKLSEITTKLGDGLHGTPKYSDNGEYYFINGNNLTNGKIVFTEKTRRVKEEEFLKYKKELTDRTIMVSINGTLGNIALYNGENVVLGKSACYFNIEEQTNKDFIKYILQGKKFKNYIINYASGTTIKNLSLKAMRDFSFLLPSLEKQEKIASILKSLDDKIEINNQMNQTLEEMAQTIFKEWFVKFNFPNDDGVPYKDNGGEMEESELGVIPKGWRVGELREFIEIKHGYAFKGKDFSNTSTKYLVLSPGNFKIGGGFKSSKFKYLINETIFPKEYIFHNNDLMVTMTDLSKIGDTLGYPAFIPSSKENIYLHNQRLGKIVHKLDFLNDFYLYQLMCTKKYRGFILGSATGTTVKHTAPKRIQEFKIPISNSDNIYIEFKKIIEPLFKKINGNSEENQILIKTRDTLLPKLMSGEVRV